MLDVPDLYDPAVHADLLVDLLMVDLAPSVGGCQDLMRMQA